MSRTLGIFGVAVVVACALFSFRSAVAPQNAGACGWHLESTPNTKGYNISEGPLITWYWTLSTYNDGCGSRYYNMHVYAWQGTGFPAAQVTVLLRVWSCGSYNGEYSYTAYNTFGTQVSSTSYSTTCGRQADDGAYPSAYVYDPTFYPSTTAVYVNQG